MQQFQSSDKVHARNRLFLTSDSLRDCKPWPPPASGLCEVHDALEALTAAKGPHSSTELLGRHGTVALMKPCRNKPRSLDSALRSGPR